MGEFLSSEAQCSFSGFKPSAKVCFALDRVGCDTGVEMLPCLAEKLYYLFEWWSYT